MTIQAVYGPGFRSGATARRLEEFNVDQGYMGGTSEERGTTRRKARAE